MKRIQFAILISAIIVNVSCGGGSDKKVYIMASGKISVEGTIIKSEAGTTHNEKILDVSGDKISVQTGSTTMDISITEPGLYILNIKNDTLVGSYQRVGTQNKTARLSQQDLQLNIDSLLQLMAGTNATAANRNFCIPPGRATKITSNVKAQIIGPYLKLPSSFEGGDELEIYKFSTNKEIRETVDKLKKLQ